MQVRAGTNVIKLSRYFVISYCLFLASIDSLVSFLWVSPGAYPHLQIQHTTKHLFRGGIKAFKALAQLWGEDQLSRLLLKRLILLIRKESYKFLVPLHSQKQQLRSKAFNSLKLAKACATGAGSTQVRRDESFAKLSWKAQLYETAQIRFEKCLVYNNQHFHESPLKLTSSWCGG